MITSLVAFLAVSLTVGGMAWIVRSGRREAMRMSVLEELSKNGGGFPEGRAEEVERWMNVKMSQRRRVALIRANVPSERAGDAEQQGLDQEALTIMSSLRTFA